MGNPTLLLNLLEGERRSLSPDFQTDIEMKRRLFINLIELALEVENPNDVIDLALSRAESVEALSSMDLNRPDSGPSPGGVLRRPQSKSTLATTREGDDDGRFWVQETDLYITGTQTCLRDIQSVVLTTEAGVPMPIIIHDTFCAKVRKIFVGDILQGMEDEEKTTCKLERVFDDDVGAKRFVRFISLTDELDLGTVESFDIVASANGHKMELHCRSRRVQLAGEPPKDDKGNLVKLIMHNHRGYYSIPYGKPDGTVRRPLVRAGAMTKLKTIGIKDFEGLRMEVEMIARLKVPVDLQYTLTCWNRLPPSSGDGVSDDDGRDNGSDGDQPSDDRRDRPSHWQTRMINDGTLKAKGKAKNIVCRIVGGSTQTNAKRKQPTSRPRGRQKQRTTSTGNAVRRPSARSDSAMFVSDDSGIHMSSSREHSQMVDRRRTGPDLLDSTTGITEDGDEAEQLAAAFASYQETVWNENHA